MVLLAKPTFIKTWDFIFFAKTEEDLFIFLFCLGSWGRDVFKWLCLHFPLRYWNHDRSLTNVSLTVSHCSIEFDRDDELFATAGVSRRIKVFDFSSVSWFTVFMALSKISAMSSIQWAKYCWWKQFGLCRHWDALLLKKKKILWKLHASDLLFQFSCLLWLDPHNFKFVYLKSGQLR